MGRCRSRVHGARGWCYIVYPAGPPWLASDRGAVGSVDRISPLGWDYLHLGWLGDLIVFSQEGSRYVVLMAVALVYTGEHYVVDVVAGWLTAAFGLAVGAVHRRRFVPDDA